MRTPPVETTIDVDGMTCASCEQRVEKTLKRLPGVSQVRADARHGTAAVTSTQPVDVEEIDTLLEPLGYRLGKSPWLSRDRRLWLTSIMAALGVGTLLVAYFASGASSLAAGLGANGQIGLWVVFGVGLAAGAATCMALVGGIVLALSAASAQLDTDSRAVRMRPQLAFQAGRIGGFALGGAALGLLGARIETPPLVQAALTMAVAVVLLLLGVRMLGISPRLSRWTLTLPASWGRRIATAGTAGAEAGPYADVRAAAAGAATFFLPCGFTQAVQLYALSTADPVYAACIMAVFALGTAPGLLALAGLANMTGGRKTPILTAVVAVVLLAFATVNAYGAAQVFKLNRSESVTVSTAEPSGPISANVTVNADSQTVVMTQNDTSYSPAETVVVAGKPIRWQITSGSPYSCAAFIRAPTMGVRADLHAGANIVDVAALAPGRYPFACVMGMYRGEIIAVEPPSP